MLYLTFRNNFFFKKRWIRVKIYFNGGIESIIFRKTALISTSKIKMEEIQVL